MSSLSLALLGIDWYCATVVSTAENWSEPASRGKEYVSQS